MEQKFKTREESQIVMTQLMLPSHSNFSGKIHGGFILNLMDQIAFACASKHSENYCVTASVNKVDFLNPIEVGELVHMKASINYAGKTSMVVGVRVEAENINTKVIKHCNSSYFTMVAKETNGKNAEIPGLVLTSVDDVRLFARSIQRQSQSRKRDETFDPTNFRMSDHLEDLKGHNLKMEID